jgi:hypothetical protein
MRFGLGRGVWAAADKIFIENYRKIALNCHVYF